MTTINTPHSGQRSPAVQDLVSWLKFSRWSGVGAAGKQRLLKQFGHPEAIEAAPPKAIAACVNKAAVATNWHTIDCTADLRWLEQPNCHAIVWNDTRYPEVLKTLSDAPPVLYVNGLVDRLQWPQVAIVGSRRQTPSGRNAASRFAAELTELGLVITSGLALGIDATAHSSCLAAGGATIAVMGHGLDQVYPARNQPLADHIVQAGCLVSEWPVGVPPRRRHFPQRNRIIAGLSDAVLVVEAAQRSGSLITARLAAEQGKEVFAVPGSIFSPQSAGCHQLIQQGAMLVQSTEDIATTIEPLLRHQLAASTADLPTTTAASQNRSPLLKVVDYAPISLEEIITRSGLTSSEVSSMLCELELDNLIERCDDGRYVRM